MTAVAAEGARDSQDTRDAQGIRLHVFTELKKPDEAAALQPLQWVDMASAGLAYTGR